MWGQQTLRMMTMITICMCKVSLLRANSSKDDTELFVHVYSVVWKLVWSIGVDKLLLTWWQNKRDQNHSKYRWYSRQWSTSITRATIHVPSGLCIVLDEVKNVF